MSKSHHCQFRMFFDFCCRNLCGRSARRSARLAHLFFRTIIINAFVSWSRLQRGAHEDLLKRQPMHHQQQCCPCKDLLRLNERTMASSLVRMSPNSRKLLRNRAPLREDSRIKIPSAVLDKPLRAIRVAARSLGEMRQLNKDIVKFIQRCKVGLALVAQACVSRPLLCNQLAASKAIATQTLPRLRCPGHPSIVADCSLHCNWLLIHLIKA